MAMNIPVLFSNGSSGAVSTEELDDLLQKYALVAFRRSDGWVLVGVNDMRDPGRKNGSSWKDRKALSK